MKFIRALPTAAKAIARKLWRILTRQSLLVGLSEEKKRLAKCAKCRHKLAVENGMDRCGLCQCILALKVKFIDEKCPNDPPLW